MVKTREELFHQSKELENIMPDIDLKGIMQNEHYISYAEMEEWIANFESLQSELQRKHQENLKLLTDAFIDVHKYVENQPIGGFQ